MNTFQALNRREWLAAAGASAVSRTFGAPEATANRPNFVIILADDLGYADVGFQGAKDIPTPNLDALAKSGVRFANGYVSHAFCSPTRAGLMTGLYQQRFGHENNPRYDRRDDVAGLPTDQVTLPQVLKNAGYATGLVGKWHLGAHPKFHPMKRGFTEMFGFLGGGHDYFKQELTGDPREYLIPIERDGQPVAEPEYLTDALSREACRFVERRKPDESFFLYLAYNAPHTPLQVDQARLAKFGHIADEKRRAYGAMISAVDDGVGRLMKTLEQQGRDRDTLVVFLSDNGGPVSVTNCSNGPLRGAKGQVWEGGIRVPFVARWTRKLKAGSTYSHPVCSIDLLPTFAGLAGGKAPGGLDGCDLMPHLLGTNKSAPHERLFWRTGGGAQYAVREGRWKLVRMGDSPPQLFDLDADAGETRDRAGEQPQVLARLDAARADWNRQLIPPLFESPRPANQKKG
jgi:arylsulfatase A-like enzyme